MIETGLAAYIQAIPTVAQYAKGVYWNLAPERSVAPYVILSQISGTEDIAHDGPTTLGNMRMQVDVYSSTTALSKQIRTAIIKGINGLTFTLSTGDVIAVCQHEMSIDFVSSEIFTTDTRFRAMCDFSLQYFVQ